MKQIFSIVLVLLATNVVADDAKNTWHNTSLTDATIKKIQQSKYEYKKCVVDEMKKKDYAKLDSRHATDAIVKKCETTLTSMRNVYLQEKVPDVIADRHLKQMRLQTTRKVLESMMFAEAARKAGQFK